MATLSFEGETHDELVEGVRRWLRSVDAPGSPVGPADAVGRLAELVDEGISVIAAAAPEPVAHSELIVALERSGRAVTDQTARALGSGLTALAELSGDRLVRRVQGAGRGAAYAMERSAADQVLRAFNLQRRSPGGHAADGGPSAGSGGRRSSRSP